MCKGYVMVPSSGHSPTHSCQSKIKRLCFIKRRDQGKRLYTKLKNKQKARSYTQNWETSKKQGVIHKTEKQAESKLYTKLKNKQKASYTQNWETSRKQNYQHHPATCIRNWQIRAEILILQHSEFIPRSGWAFNRDGVWFICPRQLCLLGNHHDTVENLVSVYHGTKNVGLKKESDIKYVHWYDDFTEREQHKVCSLIWWFYRKRAT